ncbi:MAG: hypothetical protein ACLFMO_04320 [Eubacteriales bacterium]
MKKFKNNNMRLDTIKGIKIKGVEFARLLEVSRTTLYRYINLYEEKFN